MSNKKRRPVDEEITYWLSYSDMMAALLLMFILIVSITLLQSQIQYEEKQEEIDAAQVIIEEQQQQLEEQQAELDRIIGIRTELIEALTEEFEGSSLNVSVDAKTGAITFDSSILFEQSQSDLLEEGQEFLKEFVPKYISVLMSEEYADYISEIIIEGHTDTNGTYLYNLELSQQRAFSVATFCLTETSGVLSSSDIEVLRGVLTANGKSYSDPVYNDDGSVDMTASRRVEFKFRLKDEDMIDEMMSLITGSSTEAADEDAEEVEAVEE